MWIVKGLKKSPKHPWQIHTLKWRHVFSSQSCLIYSKHQTIKMWIIPQPMFGRIVNLAAVETRKNPNNHDMNRISISLFSFTGFYGIFTDIYGIFMGCLRVSNLQVFPWLWVFDGFLMGRSWDIPCFSGNIIGYPSFYHFVTTKNWKVLKMLIPNPKCDHKKHLRNYL